MKGANGDFLRNEWLKWRTNGFFQNKGRDRPLYGIKIWQQNLLHIKKTGLRNPETGLYLCRMISKRKISIMHQHACDDHYHSCQEGKRNLLMQQQDSQYDGYHRLQWIKGSASRGTQLSQYDGYHRLQWIKRDPA